MDCCGVKAQEKSGEFCTVQQLDYVEPKYALVGCLAERQSCCQLCI